MKRVCWLCTVGLHIVVLCCRILYGCTCTWIIYSSGTVVYICTSLYLSQSILSGNNKILRMAYYRLGIFEWR